MIEEALELNRLINAFEDNNINLDTIRHEASLLKRLQEVTAAHFAREEQFILHHSLKNLERQKEQHRLFLGMINQYIQDFQDGKLWVSLQLKMAVLQWVVNHINRLDYDTFCVGNWMDGILDSANSWEDVEKVIKPTGLYPFDQEHRDLVQLTLNFNPLIASHGNNNYPSEIHSQVSALLRRICQYASGHFQHEENFLKRYQVANNHEQVDSHSRFLSMIRILEQRVEKGDSISPKELKKLVMTWWVEHINLIDYESFRMNQWSDQLLGNSTSWETMSYLIRSTGMVKLDQEHMDLIMLTLEANEVVEASQRDRLDPKAIATSVGILHHLYEFSLAHFEGEEEFIKTHAIPGYERQHDQHQSFLAMVRRLEEDMALGRMIFSTEIKTKILAWWMNHINEVDYKTFQIEKWASPLILKANCYEDFSSMIKLTRAAWANDDHRILIEKTLHVCHQLQCGHGDAKNDMQNAMQFAREHFLREEKFFTENELWGLESHQDHHNDFLMEMEKMICDPDIATPGGAERFRLWMMQWWIQHINETDYQAFMQLERE
ncbi:MAG: hemerythrin family protein [Magnetococcales bacterium]|nr:hemerythrin family protein [Magnetococcales bacterium]